MAQHGPSVTLSLTLPITCHICLGKVTASPLPFPLSPAAGAGRGGGPARPGPLRSVGGCSGGPAAARSPGPAAFVCFKGRREETWGVGSLPRGGARLGDPVPRLRVRFVATVGAGGNREPPPPTPAGASRGLLEGAGGHRPRGRPRAETWVYVWISG